jgi:PAS domain S-box-containing protein
MRRTPTTDHLADISFFRTLAQSAPLMLWTADAKGACSFANDAWLVFRGRSISDELGDGWLDAVHGDDRSVVVDSHRLAIKTRRPFTLDYRVRRADGSYRRVHHHGLPWIGEPDTFNGHIGSCVDVSDYAGVTPTTDDRAHHLSALIDHAQDIVYRMNVFPERRFDYVGGAVQAITGRTAEEFYADPFIVRSGVHPEDLDLVKASFEHPERLGPSVTLRWVHPDGKIVWAEHRRVPVFDGSGRLIAIDGIARDVTARVERQQHQQIAEEQMRELAARLQAAREDERSRVARELHDELGQILTTLKLELGRAMVALRAERLSTRVVDRLQSLMGLSEIGVATVKRIATNLRPPTLDHLGLSEAIRWEALTFKSRTGIRCNMRTNKTRSALTSEQQTALFRIFQEALTNIVRHAQASAVHVTLTERDGAFELRIRDNGKGITDEESRNPRAFGLIGMRERAALIGGAFKISGPRGKGTTVQVQLPLDHATMSAPRRPRRKER